MKTGSFFIAALALLLLAGCATTSVNMWVQRPAEINLHDFPQIAVGDIQTTFHPRSHAYDIREAFTAKLLKSDYFDAVLDRDYLESILLEHYVAWSGEVDDSAAWQLGELLGASALVHGRITKDEYREDLSHKESTRKDKQGNPYQVTEYTRKGEYWLKVNVRVIDTRTSEILGLKELSAYHNSSDSAENKEPGPIDVEHLYQLCLGDITTQFIRLVAPWRQAVQSDYERDKKYLPELDLARKHIINGRTGTALSLLEQATGKEDVPAKSRARAYYDLGLLQTYLGDFDNALANLRAAHQLVPQSKRYKQAIQICLDEQYRARLLEEQLR
ncbi:MAG TPA: CsgG/HfaB family protein [Candidatus Syntrophosphaera sp.]|jgi:curli biogenesis system outer membrane secretion channel CsgG|nr:CsgG/HfaB family protein [Candidatus Syntrophosphaera sp.]